MTAMLLLFKLQLILLRLLYSTSKHRISTRNFQATAESYNISAVTLSADGSEEGGNEVDFGTLRVGDVAEKKISLGNKGKYKIGYKFIFTRPALGRVLKISPMEGVIEPGGKDLAHISITFSCSEAMHLVGNKHVSVQLIEPVTGELVETFPLSVSTHAKYSTFRLQPSKGVTFGAVKFDSEPRTKRVELRNDG
jgi:hydrocephalus-inducing protein